LEWNPLARQFLQRCAKGDNRLLEPRRPVLPLAKRPERNAEIVVGPAPFVIGRSKRHQSRPQRDQSDEMQVASAIAAVVFERLRFRNQECRDRRHVRPVEGFGQSNNSVAGGLAVVGGEDYVALAITKRRDLYDVAPALFFFLMATGLLSGLFLMPRSSDTFRSMARARPDLPASTSDRALASASSTMAS
jgi:hypothetical protein